VKTKLQLDYVITVWMRIIDGFHSIFSLGNWRALHHHAACWLASIHITILLPSSFYGERWYGIRLYIVPSKSSGEYSGTYGSGIYQYWQGCI